jgi:hypothetical protein
VPQPRRYRPVRRKLWAAAAALGVLLSLLLLPDHRRDDVGGVDPAPLGPAVPAGRSPSVEASPPGSATPVSVAPAESVTPTGTAVAGRPGPPSGAGPVPTRASARPAPRRPAR